MGVFRPVLSHSYQTSRNNTSEPSYPSLVLKVGPQEEWGTTVRVKEQEVSVLGGLGQSGHCALICVLKSPWAAPSRLWQNITTCHHTHTSLIGSAPGASKNKIQQGAQPLPSAMFLLVPSTDKASLTKAFKWLR